MKTQPDVHSLSAPAGVARELDCDFREFIGSIAVSEEELAAIVNMPDYSIPQVKEYLRKGELTDDVVCCPLNRSLVQRPRLRSLSLS
jgi:hypothetical protein